jgi:glycosyltransferase involved in cell wall biosynthesis
MITGDRALASGKKGPFYYMLEEFSRHWERIDVVCPRIPGTSNIEPLTRVFENVYIHSSQKPLIFHPWFILKEGIKIYKEHKFDLFTIHSYPPFYNDIGGLWLCKSLSSQASQTSEAIQHQTSPSFPCILEIMHITGYPKAGNFKEWLYKILTGLFIKRFAKNAKAVRIINQNQTGEFLKKHGVAENKLKYIPAFYIDFEIFKPKTSAFGGASIEKKYDIVFSGRLVQNKGIFLLLKAIKNIKQAQRSNISDNSNKRSDLTSAAIKLIIIGDGPLKPKIEKFIKKNNLQNNVEFSGWLPTTKDVANIYNQSKMMVMSSFNEGGPRVTLEAMACKVPVLTSRVGIMNDIIEDSVNGIFIDWKIEDIANKIMLLLKDDNLRNKIAENGHQTVQQFERKKVIENYARTYQNLLHTS